ncbi:GNAT family N-acetyltransferase [Thalassotalea montiporae]
MNFPQLATERLLLTQLTQDDAAAILELFSNPQVIEYYDLSEFTEISQATDLISFFHKRFTDSTGIRWGIRLKQSNQLVGTCGFNSWSPAMKNAVIGYDLNPKFWRQGLAFEAVQAIVKAAFAGELACGAIHRIQADTVPGNYASEALLERLGFKLEGIRRESGYWNGQFHDLKCFGLLATEYSMN